VQKAFGLPPGVTVVAVSERALEKARTVPNRGWYLDIATMDEYYKKKNFQTPSTPSIPHFYALDYQLSRFFEEGLENRFRRHIEMAEFVRKWAKENWEIFPEEKYSSITLTCIKNTKNISIKKLNELLFERGMWLSNGYGDLKEKTFRIAHMADLTLKDLEELIDNIEDILKNHPEVYVK
jgi:aspartate aminotransferase-like enzyme